MTQWFFYDENGYRIGPFDDATMKSLALDGTLSPDSVIETESGKKAKAESIKGLTFISHDLNSDYFVPPPLPVHSQSYASPASGNSSGGPETRLVQTTEPNMANIPIVIDPKNWGGGAWLILLSAGLAILSFILPWQDIAPPSLHESGKRYSWQKPLVPPEQLPPIPQAWIDGFLPKRGSKLVVPKYLATSIPDDKIITRCRKYVGTMPEAVDGQGGHNTTLSVANAIFWGFGLDEQAGWPILVEYNERCKPPWAEWELRHKMNEARDKPPNREYCWLLNANRNRYHLGDFDYDNKKQERMTDKTEPIYRLPQIAESLKTQNRIYVCGTERAADAAVSIGLPATAPAKNATKTNWVALDMLAPEGNRKLEIVILQDNDRSGREHADSVAEIFTKFKSNPTVKIVSLADCGHVTGISLEKFPEGGNLYDLLELLDGKTETDIMHMIEKMIDETLPELEIIEDEADGVYPWRPFPVEALPSIVAQHVLANAAASGCDPANVALADLVVLASAIGNSRRLQLKRGWIFPSIIWGMIVARKGSIKTWSMVPSVKPLHMMQEEYHRQYDREKAEFDRRRTEYMLLSARQRREEPPFDLMPPVRRRILSRDATEARIIKNMSENPRGFCVFCDELTTLIKGFGQYTKDGKGGNGQSIFNTIFNGEGIESERMDESRYSPNACLSILGSIQPGMLKRCFDQEAFESGFASRFLIASPPLRVASWTDAFVSEDIETDFHRLVFELLRLEMEPISAASTVEYDEWNPDGITRSGEQIGVRPALVDTSPEALAVYQEFFDHTAEEMRTTDDDNVRGAFEKHRAYVARLALVIHVVRAVEQRIMFENDPTRAPWSADRINEFVCDADSMRAAVVIGEWFKYEVLRAYATWGGLADETPTIKANSFQQRIIEFMEQKQTPVSLRELKRKFRTEADALAEAVGELVARGILEPTESSKGGPGPRKEAYRLKK